MLAVYPFIEPEQTNEIVIPQKIDGKWLAVTYNFKKIDMSPQSGLLASLLEDEDRMYAYALEPVAGQNPQANAHLLFMGTTFPTGQGEALADLYNFYPRRTVGEAHNTSNVNKWIAETPQKIIMLGLSKGADNAMIKAAEAATQFPGKVNTAYCFNPTALAEPTLNRLLPAWKSCSDEIRPLIQVVVQKGDPVFPLENGFLPQTQISEVSSVESITSNYKKLLPAFIQKASEAHIHNFSGRKSIIIRNKTVAEENLSRGREFRGDIKGALNWLLFPVKYISLCASLKARKLERQSSYAKIVTRPLGLIGKICRSVVQITTILPVLMVVTIFSGIKTAARSLFGIRSDYQAAVEAKIPASNVSPNTVMIIANANIRMPLLTEYSSSIAAAPTRNKIPDRLILPDSQPPTLGDTSPVRQLGM
jgi:hypothetical protein